MKHWAVALLSGALLAATASPARPEDSAESVERRLQDAQRRLEEVAREIAELSGEGNDLHAFRPFEYFVPGRGRAMLGVNLGGVEPGGGVRVASVSPGGPAEAAGVKAGDVIVAVDARPVATGRELVRAMETTEPGDKVVLKLERDGKPIELAVEARELDWAFVAGAPAFPAVRPLPDFPAMHALGDMHWLLGTWSDAELVTLTPGLGRYFGAEKGVLVARAPDDPAFGLKDGDVIVAIGGREPQTGTHAMRILRSYQAGESVELRILRDRRTQTLTATIPESAKRDVLRFAPPRPPAPPAPPRSAAPT